MPVSDQALVNADLLSWARERAGLSIPALAEKMKAGAEKLEKWESGEERPSFVQAQKLAKIMCVPFGYLFLEKRPEEDFPLPDLRTIGGARVREPSPELRDVVRDVLLKQEWYLEYLKEQGGAQKLAFVGKFTTSATFQSVVADMKRTLKTPDKPGDLFSALVATAEEAGILVMRSGIVGTNTHRALQVDDFRGFAIADFFAPVVFINSADAPSARLFTLVHELAHLWIGSSGVSEVGAVMHRREEIFCNRVAAEFLVPEADFLQAWNHQTEWRFNLRLSARFQVSAIVIAQRALTLDLIDQAQFSLFYKDEIGKTKAKNTGGGDFYMNAAVRNSRLLSRAVVHEALSGRMLLRDAGRLLGVPPNKISEYEKRIFK